MRSVTARLSPFAAHRHCLATSRVTLSPCQVLQLQLQRRGAAAPAVLAEPSPTISVHKGLKIQAALCVERPPLQVLEPDFKKKWRAFKEDWEFRTNSQLSLSDEIVFMRFYFHFLEDPKKKLQSGSRQVPLLGTLPGGRARGAGASASGRQKAVKTEQPRMSTSSPSLQLTPSEGSLESMIAEEGLDLRFPQIGKRTMRRKKVKERVVDIVDDSDVRSLRRLGDRSLFLLIRYEGAKRWTFPKADRIHGQAMRETLFKLCERQLGSGFKPYVVGACPFAHLKRHSDKIAGLDGRKIFYYRARLVPGIDFTGPSDNRVVDWAWFSRAELSEHLNDGEWHAVRYGLPLDFDIM